MHVSGFWSFMGAILLLALVAVVLTKPNTSGIIGQAGTSFNTILGGATAG